MTPGGLIRAVRERHGLTQAQLALRAGSTQASISRLEHDERSPSMDTLARLLAVMGEELTLGSRRVQVDYDDDHMADTLALPPAERLERALAWNEFAADLAAAGARDRAER